VNRMPHTTESTVRADAAPADALRPIRARRAQYARDRGWLRQVLREGNERANTVAEATLKEVRRAMNSHY
jgi:tryptophanyl-tRNA synthetase